MFPFTVQMFNEFFNPTRFLASAMSRDKELHRFLSTVQNPLLSKGFQCTAIHLPCSFYYLLLCSLIWTISFKKLFFSALLQASNYFCCPSPSCFYLFPGPLCLGVTNITGCWYNILYFQYRVPFELVGFFLPLHWCFFSHCCSLNSDTIELLTHRPLFSPALAIT